MTFHLATVRNFEVTPGKMKPHKNGGEVTIYLQKLNNKQQNC
jgi:hypothetical protein